MFLLAMLLIKEKQKHIENNSSQGWKKALYGSPPGQVDILAGQVTLKHYLSNR